MIWVEAGFLPDTFWKQTHRSFTNSVAGAARRNVTLAWQIAGMTAVASAGKLPTLDSLLAPKEATQAVGSAKLLNYLFKLKGRGVPMTVERIERVH